MARKHRDEGGGDTWLNTYADMVTLLLTFFVMLFSMSSVQEDKWQIILKAFTNNAGTETDQIVLVPEGEGDQMGKNKSEFPLTGENKDSLEAVSEMPETFNDLYQYLKSYVESSGMSDSVSIGKQGNTIYIRFENSIFFDPDKATLKLSSIDMLTFIGDALKNVEQYISTININGHTAAIPNAPNYKINDRLLSSERASNVAIFFEENKKIDPTKIFAIGHGKNFPIASNDTPEGQTKNRRVDMMIVSNEADDGSQKMIEELLKGTYNPDLYPKTTESGTEILVPQPNGPPVPSDAAAPDAAATAPSGAAALPDVIVSAQEEIKAPSATRPTGDPDVTNYDALEPK